MASFDRVSLLRGARLVLDRSTWSVSRGERSALCGANGAGKSSFLRLLAGLELPSAGEVLAPRPVGYLPQCFGDSVFPWFSVLKNVAMPLLAARRGDAHVVASRMCRSLLPDIDPARPAGRLSGGEQQAMALARALASPGELVLLDEPFSALSVERTRLARQVVDREVAGRALVLVSHDLGDTTALCSVAFRLGGGQLERSPLGHRARSAAE